jgi:circularin A/uberolysin family circular bacteriocin
VHCNRIIYKFFKKGNYSMGLFHVASKFNVSKSIATAVVTTVIHAGTFITVIGAVTVLLSGGIDAIMELGWAGFVTAVKEKVAARGTAGAVAW